MRDSGCRGNVDAGLRVCSFILLGHNRCSDNSCYPSRFATGYAHMQTQVVVFFQTKMISYIVVYRINYII